MDENSEKNIDNSNNKTGKISLKELLSRKEFIAVIVFFTVFLALLIYTFFTPNYYNRHAPVTFEIAHGQSLGKTIDSLYAYGIIPNRTNMRVASFIYGADKRIKAGRYKIPNGLSYVSLVELLIKGEREVPISVTFQEGITISQFAHILKKKLNADSSEVVRLCSDTSFIKKMGLNVPTLEGYLLPETYFFYAGTTPEKVILRLRREFEKFFTDSMRSQLGKSNYTLHEILTVASIVDGESNKPEEFPLIAGVYYNRLKQGMKLQADPTVQYSFNGKWRRLLYKDLLVKSPYNTYLNYGLPPGPINNPGKAAIMAAVYPAAHNYVYFVADGKGGHKFTATYDEHLKAVDVYRSSLGRSLQK